MRGFVSNAIRCVARHGSSIVAVSSLAIATAALYLTVQAQKEDRYYKELLIKPFLSIVAHTTDFSVGIVNDGLGPAYVEDITYHFGEECLSLLEANGRASRTNYYKVNEAIRTRLFTELFSFGIPGTESTVITTHQQVLFPESIIPVGKSVTLFKIDDSSLETFQRKIDALDMKFAQNLKDGFTARALTLPLYMKYCSMSGRYCNEASREDAAQKPCKSK